MMILYIHGFSGHGFGTKAQLVQKYFAKNNVVTPSLPYIPTLAIDILKQQINFVLQYEDVFLIGSSLGGYYATCLADYFKIKTVLLTPVVDPSLLSRYSGNHSFENFENYVPSINKFFAL